MNNHYVEKAGIFRSISVLFGKKDEVFISYSDNETFSIPSIIEEVVKQQLLKMNILK